MNSNKPQKTAVSTVEIGTAQLNQRLDNFLIKHLADVPRTRVYRIIRKGEVRVNRKRCKPDYRLQLGDQVRIPPLQANQEPRRKAGPPPRLVDELAARMLFENDNLVVIDKPAGLAVHAGSGLDYGVIDAMRLLYPNSDIELLHRLDRDTSGCLLLAKHRPALLELQQHLRQNRIGKNYIAVVRGSWPRELRQIELPLARYHLPNGERRVRVDPAGQAALTRVKTVEAGKLFSALRLELVTGRTHQIRVHCQAQGHPIAGDDKYGDTEFNGSMRKRGIRRLMLHASSIELPRGGQSPEQVVNAPLPPEFELLLGAANAGSSHPESTG